MLRGRRLILNDGTIIENGVTGLASGFLWLRLPGYTMQEAAAIAFDESKTARIEFQYGDMEDVYEGYTSCIDIMVDGDRISVCMIKG